MASEKAAREMGLNIFVGSSKRHSRDVWYANFTRRRGYDSLQILKSNPRPFQVDTVEVFEIVLTTPSCMTQPAPLASGCVPVPVLSGWRPRRPCACNHDIGDFPLLNCAAASRDEDGQ